MVLTPVRDGTDSNPPRPSPEPLSKTESTSSCASLFNRQQHAYRVSTIRVSGWDKDANSDWSDEISWSATVSVAPLRQARTLAPLSKTPTAASEDACAPVRNRPENTLANDHQPAD